MNILRQEVLRYIATGVVNTAFGFTLIFLCVKVGLQDILANFVGYASGFIISFLLNGKWTFRRSALAGHELYRFLFVVVGAYLINIVVMLSVRDVLELDRLVAQLAGVLSYAVVGFLGMKFIAFKER